MDSGETEAEEVLVPGLKSLGEDCVVCIGCHLGYDRPSVIPIKAVIVKKDTHKLRHAKCGVSIVDVNSNLIRQIFKRSIYSHMVADNTLHRCGHKEILLRKSKQLTLRMVVRGIKHLGNDLCVGTLLKGASILSLREKTHIEVMNIASLPKTKLVHLFAVVFFILFSAPTAMLQYM